MTHRKTSPQRTWAHVGMYVYACPGVHSNFLLSDHIGQQGKVTRNPLSCYFSHSQGISNHPSDALEAHSKHRTHAQLVHRYDPMKLNIRTVKKEHLIVSTVPILEAPAADVAGGQRTLEVDGVPWPAGNHATLAQGCIAAPARD